MTTDNQVKPNTIQCTPMEFKTWRQELGLSVRELAQLLDTDERSIRSIETEEGFSTHRKPAPRMVRLMEAYLAGYRPVDWPQGR